MLLFASILLYYRNMVLCIIHICIAWTMLISQSRFYLEDVTEKRSNHLRSSYSRRPETNGPDSLLKWNMQHLTVEFGATCYLPNSSCSIVRNRDGIATSSVHKNIKRMIVLWGVNKCYIAIDVCMYV